MAGSLDGKVAFVTGGGSGIGAATARMAVRGYTRSILTSMTDVDLDLGTLSVTMGIVVPAAIVVSALALTSWRLNEMEVA